MFVDVRGDSDSDQPGLPDAEVVVRGETGTPSFSGTTNASGWLTLSGLPVGQDYVASVTGWTLRGDERAGYPPEPWCSSRPAAAVAGSWSRTDRGR